MRLGGIHELTPAKLANVMSQLVDGPGFAARPRAVGRRIDPRAGITQAADAVEQQSQRRQVADAPTTP